MSILDLTPTVADARLPYGAESSQFGELRLPTRGDGPFPVVVNIHGGFWRARYDLSHASPLCADLAARGFATWNLEYRRIGEAGGGWPGTFEDVANGVAHAADLARHYPLDLDRVVLMGHSAGGQLALWVAKERLGFTPRGVVALAPVADLRRAWELKLSDTVVADLLGGAPDERPAQYDIASPIERLPLGVPVRIVHGAADDIVPIELSERYVAAARAAGDRATLHALPDSDHFAPIDPRSDAWRAVVVAVKSLLAKAPGVKG